MSPNISEEAAKFRGFWLNLVQKRRELSRNPGNSRFDYYNTKLVQYDGGTDRSGRRYKPIWDNILVKCSEANVDPYKMALFLFRTTHGDIVPDPRQVYHPEVISDYQSYLTRKYEAIGPQLQTDRALFSTVIRQYSFRSPDPDKAYSMALRDISVSPLFRFIACHKNLRLSEEVKEKLLEELAIGAYSQFVVNPAIFLDTWKEVLTPDVLDSLKQKITKKIEEGAIHVKR